jgi:hypothetical protein
MFPHVLVGSVLIVAQRYRTSYDWWSTRDQDRRFRGKLSLLGSGNQLMIRRKRPTRSLIRTRLMERIPRLCPTCDMAVVSQALMREFSFVSSSHLIHQFIQHPIHHLNIDACPYIVPPHNSSYSLSFGVSILHDSHTS